MSSFMGVFPPPPAATRPQTGPPILPSPPHTRGGDELSLCPSGTEWEGEEGDEEIAQPSEPPIPEAMSSPQVLAAAVVEPQPPAPIPKVPGFAGQQVPDEILFPAHRPVSVSLLGDNMMALLEAVEKEVPIPLSVAPKVAETTTSLRKLVSGGSLEETPGTKRFPVDVSVCNRLQSWSRGSSKDWSSYSKSFNQEVQARDQDYEQWFKTPVIPEDVWIMLQNPQQGAPKASQSEAKGYRLKDASAQRREDSLRALDRSLRTGIKYQSLAVWSVEGLASVLQDADPQLTERAAPLLKGLSDLVDGTIDQMARASVKVSGERRENLLPLLGLTDTTVSDLRRLPHEGKDVFAGHYQAVLSRQASRQEVLRHNKRLAAKALPKSTASATAGRKAPGGPRGAGARRRHASAARPPPAPVASSGPWKGKVSVTAGQRTFSPPHKPASRGRGRGRGRRF